MTLQKKAYSEVRRLLSVGKIHKKKRCQICKEDESLHSLHAHHADYNKPQKVVWLCPSCHKRIHSGWSTKKIRKIVKLETKEIIDPIPDWLTVKQATGILGYRDIGSIHRLILRGNLPKYRKLGKICLNKRDVLKLLEPQKMK